MEKKNDAFIFGIVGLIILLLPLQCFASGHIPTFSLGDLLLALLPFPTILILSFFTFGFIRMRSPKAGLFCIIQFILTVAYCIPYYQDSEGIDGWLMALIIPLIINTILLILNLIWKKKNKGKNLKYIR